ncbi:MAG: HAD hydrolase family protein [Deltaproteobacteria bacterium]|nr:HAD hydrolase family protein [Deltaproteobacteria bacterium]
MPAGLLKKAQAVKLLLLDVDGVLTDGSIVIDARGGEIKRFDVRDGEGIKLLMRARIGVGLISGRASKAVAARARELGIRTIHQGVRDKRRMYEKIKARTRLTDREIAYVGDDLADLPLLRRAGLAIAINDGWHGLKALVDYVTHNNGGRGAVREVAENILRAQGKWASITEEYYR